VATHVLDRGPQVRSRPTEDRFARIRQIDLVLIASTISISLIGMVAVYAATRTTAGVSPTYYLKRQVVFSVIGIVVMAVLAYIDYRRLEQWAYLVFGGLIVCLLGVFAFDKSEVTAGTGASASGVADRWIPLGPFQFQPSEFAMLGVIAVLALYMTRHADELDIRHLLPMFAMVAVPLLIIVKQNDLGTAIVMVIVVLALLLVGGVKLRYITGVVALGVLAFFLAIELHLVQSYQLDRLTNFLHPNTGRLSGNLQVDQAKIAIGAGGFSGTGLFHGVFTNGNYVPEQSTDFIFATVGEQLGFAGSAVIIGLYSVMALRILRAAQSARDGLGRLLCVGVLAFVGFSVFQNVGMNVGLMPVTGIPLPLISYGGSAIIVFYAAVGLVLNVEMRRGRTR